MARHTILAVLGLQQALCGCGTYHQLGPLNDVPARRLSTGFSGEFDNIGTEDRLDLPVTARCLWGVLGNGDDRCEQETTVRISIKANGKGTALLIGNGVELARSSFSYKRVDDPAWSRGFIMTSWGARFPLGPLVWVVDRSWMGLWIDRSGDLFLRTTFEFTVFLLPLPIYGGTGAIVGPIRFSRHLEPVAFAP